MRHHMCASSTPASIAATLCLRLPSLPPTSTRSNPAGGVDDAHGHGTEMAGVALAGDLAGPLAGNHPVEIDHHLESVKLVPRDGATGTDPRHHGYLTVEAVARPEVTAPSRLRVFGMAVTARDNRDRGRPSAWSAAVDSLAADVDGYGENPRLLVISAGNVADPVAWSNYPDSNETDGIHDPAQAWNALTVGACTDLVRITEPGTNGYAPIAESGGLSPFSTTSLTWERHWPLKPDVVLEGGNAARDAFGAVWMPSLSLLTTHFVPTNRLFTTTNATSAATALASRFAARVMVVYPSLWPETIRALIVHSAEWTDAMKRRFLPVTRSPTKQDYSRLVQWCGFGVPDIDRALWTVGNSLTMVVEESLHPFRGVVGRDPILRDMHLHDLPWPTNALESLGETEVEMRVTLSYFIEPNPSQRGVRSRYRYESHGLRFRRPASDGIDERVSEPDQPRFKGRGGRNTPAKRRRPFVAHRNPRPSPRFVAQRNLAWNRGGSREPGRHCRLPHGRLVEDPPQAGAIRPGSAVPPWSSASGHRKSRRTSVPR